MENHNQCMAKLREDHGTIFYLVLMYLILHLGSVAVHYGLTRYSPTWCIMGKQDVDVLSGQIMKPCQVFFVV